VRIEGMKFVPERLEVAAGDRVTWVNRDFVPHSVTASANAIESGDLTEGKRWSYVPKTAGEIAYLCRLHPTMKATLVVK
jgi:plastocyanin